MSVRGCTSGVSAALNNRAASEIQAGSYANAMQCLHSALVNERDRLHRIREREHNVPSSLVSLGHCYSFPPTKAPAHATHDSSPCSPMSHSSEFSCVGKVGTRHNGASADLFLFHKPLQVNLGAIGQVEQREDSLVPAEDVLSFATIYNLALCKHLEALTTQSTEKKPEKLKQALALYSQAMRVLPQARQGQHRDSKKHRSVTMIEIVISNNMGHAYNSMGCTGRAYQHFQRMASVLVVYRNTFQGYTDPRSQPDEGEAHCVDGFLHNLGIVLSWLVATAAAAA